MFQIHKDDTKGEVQKGNAACQSKILEQTSLIQGQIVSQVENGISRLRLELDPRFETLQNTMENNARVVPMDRDPEMPGLVQAKLNELEKTFQNLRIETADEVRQSFASKFEEIHQQFLKIAQATVPRKHYQNPL